MLTTLAVITELRDREARLRRRSGLPRPVGSTTRPNGLRRQFGGWLVRLGIAVAGTPAPAAWTA